MISYQEKQHLYSALVKYYKASKAQKLVLESCVLKLIDHLDIMKKDSYYKEWDILSRLSACRIFIRIIK